MMVAGTVIDVSNSEHNVIVEMNDRDLTLIVDGERMINVLHQIETEQPALSIDNAVWGSYKGKNGWDCDHVDGWCLHPRLELNLSATNVEIMAIKIGLSNNRAKKKHGDASKDGNYDFQAIMIRNKHTQLIDPVMQFHVALPAEYAELQGEWVLVRTEGKPQRPWQSSRSSDET